MQQFPQPHGGALGLPPHPLYTVNKETRDCIFFFFLIRDGPRDPSAHLCHWYIKFQEIIKNKAGNYIAFRVKSDYVHKKYMVFVIFYSNYIINSLTFYIILTYL